MFRRQRQGSVSRVYRRASHSGTIPATPKEQSISRQNIGMPRNPPTIRANGTTSTQAIMPNSITQMFRTGSRIAPMKAMAMTMWAKASQSVP